MIVGKVVGSIVSTRKSEKLIGNKFMIVEPVHHMKAEHSQIVATDRQSGYHSYELCRVRTITETSQTVVGKARI